MDTVTQFALGAAVGAAVLGRRLGPRKAVVVGGILGSLPDLDVFYPFDGPIDAFVLHRGPTHSLVVQAAATPLLGEALVRLFRGLRDGRLVTYAAVYLCLATHALLDALTVYGTRLFWPLWNEPIGTGSVFIIDPLYTIPLLVAVVWALCLGAWTARFGRVLVAALVVSTGYLAWGLAAQRISADRAAAELHEAGISTERLLATATPFNSLLWRVIAVDEGRYFNLYVPILADSDDIAIYAHRRLDVGTPCLDANDGATRLARFSKGFYRADIVDGAVVVSDLRMGLTPNYAFRFMVAEIRGGVMRSVPPQRVDDARQADGDIEWLLAGLAGNSIERPAESAAIVARGMRVASTEVEFTSSC
ncbi:MAG: metal-dependent hydrolase [Alphaproteobacteria bacterium]|nr:metal-dependent hydrolase [Alphaproteobacteria bacterium]